MRVLVIEYEKSKAQKIKDLLYDIDDSIQVVGVTGDIQTAADWLTKNNIPDIILANADSIAGVNAGNRPVKTLVKFSTNSEEFHFVAFRYKTIRQLMEQLPPTEEGLANPQLWQDAKPFSTGGHKERFLVKQGQKLLSVHVDQVAYFFSEDRFIFLRTFDNQKFPVEYRMEQLESLLSPVAFFRVNRSFIVSLPTVKEIHAYFGNRLKLYLTPSPGNEVIVSRQRVSDFKDWLGK